MRLSQVRYRQHLGHMFKKHWRLQGQRVPIDSGAETELKTHNILVHEPKEVLADKLERFKIEIIGYKENPIERNETHPDWHENKCLLFKDDNVLLEGIEQAKALTKTIELDSGLPNKLKDLLARNIVTKSMDDLVQRSILSSNVYDCQQEKLPKVIDPNRPAFNFPRVLGITDQRKNRLLTLKLLQICEKIAGPELALSRSIVNDAFFSVPHVLDGELLQMEVHAEAVIFTKEGLPPCISNVKDTEQALLPDLFPVKRTVTIPTENIYKLKNSYPIATSSEKQNIHTIFLHFSPLDVKNLYESAVTESQILGRSLIKSFAAAAANARIKFGESVGILPDPMTVQCIQTDGRLYDFSVFQLNTLELDGTEGLKNIWYHTKRLPLYTKCCIEDGKPTLTKYNKEVVQHLLAFYINN